MESTEADLEDEIVDISADIRRKAGYWRDGIVPIDGVTNVAYSTARDYERLAKTAALLDATRQSRAWFGEAARFYFAHVRAGRLRRDIRERSVWEGEPRKLWRAMACALLSRDETLLAEIASDALDLDDAYLEAFADEYHDSPSHYYRARVFAALVLQDGRTGELLEAFEASVEQRSESNQYWQAAPRFYRGLVDGSEADVEAALSDLHEFYVDNAPEPDDPNAYVLHYNCAQLLLARRRGFEVDIESDRLAGALLRDDLQPDDIVLDVDVPGIEMVSDVDLFELEGDEAGSPVIAARIYHPGGKPVTAEDVPELAVGRVLSDSWIEAALEEAERRDHYEDSLVAEARDAYEDGTLTRKLVVVQERMDEHTFDESLAALPVDDIELEKGAGRRG